jgi:lysophospholipase L1-like esterase
MTRRLVVGATLSLMAVLGSVLVAEAVVRLGGFETRLAQRLAYVNRADLPVHEAAEDPALSLRLRPGARADFPPNCPWCDDPRRVSVSPEGYRGATRPTDLRVLALGGSFTYGAAVSDDPTWPARLEERLRQRDGRWAVWNGGVSSWNTSQKLHRLAAIETAWQPALVVLQVHNRGPKAFLPDTAGQAGARWRARPDDLEENLDRPPSAMPGPALLWRTSLGRLLLYVREAKVRAGRNGALTPTVTERIDARSRVAWEAALESTSTPIVVLRPAAGGGEPWWPDAGVPMLDLVGRSPTPEPSWTDIHPGREAYAWVAEELFDWLDRRGCWAALEAGADPSPCAAP